MQQHTHIVPHIIITDMPIFIMSFMRLQHSIIISLVMPPIGVILHTMESPDISQVMPHIIIGTGIIIGIMFGIIDICGIIPLMFIIGIALIIHSPVRLAAPSPRRA